MSSTGSSYLRSLTEATRLELVSRWSKGDPARLDEYLERYPELHHVHSLLTLAWEEYRLRRAAGELTSRSEYGRRYPIDVTQWPESSEISRAELTKTSQILIDPAETASLLLSPSDHHLIHFANLQVDHIVLGFRILGELGRGTFGAVYLAQQVEMADRLVAIKVSREISGEVRKLAKLQHTHIVPVYSIHRSESIQAICMPYLGSTTLAHILSDMRTLSQFPTTGEHLAQTIARRNQVWQKYFKEKLPNRIADDCTRQMAELDRFRTTNYFDTVLRIVSQLADGLDHAHQRGLIHRDIKPGNILLTDDGTPMLLDFNLADERLELPLQESRFGGTIPFMSPEQLANYTRERVSVGVASDIYSLGLVMYQMLTMKYPFQHYTGDPHETIPLVLAERQKGVPSLRTSVPSIPWAIEGIVQKCLQLRPEDRYASAAALKEDIDRQLSNRSLKYLPEPSSIERVQKFFRRNPELVAPSTMFAMLCAILMLLLGLGLRSTLRERAYQQDHLRDQARQQLESFLRDAEKSRSIVLADPSQHQQAMVIGMSALKRYRAFDPDWELLPQIRWLPAEDQARLREEIHELAFILSNAQGDEADLLRQLAERFDPRKRKNTTPEQQQHFADRQEFLRAYVLAHQGKYEESLVRVRAYLQQHPNDFAAWFLKGCCLDNLENYNEALASFGTCLTIRPQFAHGYVARASILLRHRHSAEEARIDLDRAIQLEPHFLTARVDRAMVLLSQNRTEPALADLNYLIDQPNVPSRIWFLRAMVREQMGDRQGARQDRERGLAAEPTDALSWLARGMAHAHDSPEQALHDFRKAQEMAPRYLEPRLNQAWLLSERLHQDDAALRVLDDILKIRPDHPFTRMQRAILLARSGAYREAVTEARSCLRIAQTPELHYQAGCVMALASQHDSALRLEAVRHLSIAMFRGFGHDLILHDTDLKSLWDDPGFRRLMDSLRLFLNGEPPKSK